jgi:hypothetical protein
VPMVGTASVLGAGGAARELVRSAAKESAGVSVAAVAEASGRSESAEVVAGTREVVRPQAALSLGVSNAASAGASRRSELPGTPVAELVESTVRESGMPGGVRT